MEKTPLSMRKHIVMIGRTNAGKSTLFNALLGQDRAIVSDISGTTTDPVIKATELIPYGPVALADTAGFGDTSPLGKQREEKTKQLLRRADLVLWLCDIQEEAAPPAWVQAPVLTVYTKCELLSQEELAKREEKEPKAVYLSNHAAEGLDELKKRMVAELEKQGEEEDTLIGHLLPRGSCVVMVVPIDSAAPNGRLILPQVQLLRDCLDHDIKAYVTKETMLAEALEDIKKVDLVVTDSQVFGLVDRLVPKDIMLTSFSMLLAAQKGNFMQYIEGAEKLAQLKSGDRVLVLEGCSHNRTHEDIGRVKIPQCIEKKTGARCEYHYRSGYDFPSDLRDYALILSCGMCMIHSKEVRSRLKCAEDQDIPMVNYGVALAYVNGILDRAKEIFIKPKK